MLKVLADSTAHIARRQSQHHHQQQQQHSYSCWSSESRYINIWRSTLKGPPYCAVMRASGMLSVARRALFSLDIAMFISQVILNVLFEMLMHHVHQLVGRLFECPQKAARAGAHRAGNCIITASKIFLLSLLFRDKQLATTTAVFANNRTIGGNTCPGVSFIIHPSCGQVFFITPLIKSE